MKKIFITVAILQMTSGAYADSAAEQLSSANQAVMESAFPIPVETPMFQTVFEAQSNGSDGKFAYKLAKDESGEYNHVTFTGEINPEAVSGWASALTQINRSLNTVVYINSPGGYNSDGDSLIRSIKLFSSQQKERGTKVTGVVTSLCASMCIPLFYAFEERRAARNAVFGFHGSAQYGNVSIDQTDIYISDMMRQARERQDFKTTIWLGRAMVNGMFFTTELTSITASSLAAQNSGIVMTGHLIQ